VPKKIMLLDKITKKFKEISQLSVEEIEELKKTL